MKKIFLYLPILATLPCIAQSKFSYRNYQVDDKYYYKATGVPPGSTIAFYEKEYGGRLLRTETVGTDGIMETQATEGFRPYFAMNTGTGGTSMIQQTTTADFILKNVELQPSENGDVINWRAAVNSPNSRIFVIFSSLDGKNYVKEGIININGCNMYSFRYIAAKRDAESPVLYKLGLYDNTEGELYSTYIQAPEKSNKLNLYPNPAGDFIQIDEKFIGKEYSFFNVKGQCVARGFVSKVIPVSSLLPGIYTFSVAMGGELYSKTLIKK